MRQLVVNRKAAGTPSNSFCWFCHAVPKLPLSCGILLQLRIGVGRQHLAVGVDAHACALGLLQQKLQVVQVVAGDDDERARLHLHGDGGGLRRAVSARVGLIEQPHAAEVHLAHLQRQGQKRVHRARLGQLRQGVGEELVDSRVAVAQHPGVVGVGRRTAQAEQHEGLERADVLVVAPDLVDVVVGDRLVAGRGGHGGRLGAHRVLKRDHGLPIEVHVGHAGEQAVHDEIADTVVLDAGLASRAGQSDHRPGQRVLGIGHIGRLAAHAGAAGAGLALRHLLALEAKHLLCRHRHSLSVRGPCGRVPVDRRHRCAAVVKVLARQGIVCCNHNKRSFLQ